MEEKRFTKSLCENVLLFQQAFDESMDFVLREFEITGTKAALITMDGLVNKQTIAQSILNPILNAATAAFSDAEKYRYIRDHALATVEQLQVVDFADALDKLMAGFALLLLDGSADLLAFGVQGFDFRSVSEPENETTQRGSKEGFVEPYQVNASMIRRRLRTPDLKFERMTVGSESNTAIALCYLRSAVSDTLLQRIRANIHKIPLKTVFAAGYLSPFLEKGGIFNDVGYTERPDTVCGKIAEGRVAVLVDGTPNVLIIPYLFVENFQSFDDYINPPYFATFVRWLKYFSFFLSMFLPGLYVAAVTFHPEVIPDALLRKIVLAEASTPLPVLAEAFLVTILYEIMREAGLRVQKPLGQAVSIVGGLVIGESAVNAGIVGSLTLMIIALATLASYATPKLYEAAGAMRMLLLLLGGLFGIWGITLGFCAVLIEICGRSVYGVPFTAPLSPFRLSAMRDVLIRANWKTLSKHAAVVQNMPGAEAPATEDQKNDRKGN